MPTTPTLRDATPADLPAIQQIYAYHVRHGTGTFEESAPPLEEMRARYADVLERGLPYLVACVDEVVVGYGYAAPYRLRSAYRYTVEDSIYVAADSHGGGIGRMLLAGLIERCRLYGARQMIAVIGDAANSASVGLHRGQGFEMIGTLPAVGFKFDTWLDVVLMQRELGDGSRTLPD